MKKIVITGGSNGIGLECVKKFSANGYLVFILDNKEPSSKLNADVILVLEYFLGHEILHSVI